MKFTILGCGNSTGVPAIGGVWGVCDPLEPKNRRTRCSLLVESETTKIVIDTGPDFHAQLTRHNIQTIDAVLYTHAHSDHMVGIDDIRAITFRSKSVTPVYGSRETMAELTRLYDYLFFGGKSKIYPPILEQHILEYENKIRVGDIEFSTFAMDHGTCVSTGYRFGDFAYATDFLQLDDRAVAAHMRSRPQDAPENILKRIEATTHDLWPMQLGFPIKYDDGSPIFIHPLAQEMTNDMNSRVAEMECRI